MEVTDWRLFTSGKTHILIVLGRGGTVKDVELSLGLALTLSFLTLAVPPSCGPFEHLCTLPSLGTDFPTSLSVTVVTTTNKLTSVCQMLLIIQSSAHHFITGPWGTVG